MISKISDKELISEIKRGSEKALKKILDKYSKITCKVAYDYVEDYMVAQDISQEAFIKLYRNIDSIKEPYNIKNWLCTVVKNMAINWLNKQKFTKVDIDDISHQLQEKSFTEKDKLDQQQKIVRKVIDSMDEKYKKVVILYHVVEYTVKEISRKLEIPESTIYTRLRRSREQLKSELSGKIRRKMEQVSYQKGFNFLKSKINDGLLLHPCFLHEISPEKPFECTFYSLSEKNLNDLMVLMDSGYDRFVSIFTDDPDIYRLYLNSIPSNLLNGSTGFMMYKSWMLDLLKKYIDLKSEKRTLYIYGFPVNKKISVKSGSIKQLGEEELDILPKLPPEWLGRRDNLIKKKLVKKGDVKIFGRIKGQKLINYTLIQWKMIGNNQGGFWNIEYMWTDKKYRRRGIARESLLKAVKWVLSNNHQVYSCVEDPPLKINKKHINYNAARNMFAELGFELCSKKQLRIM